MEQNQNNSKQKKGKGKKIIAIVIAVILGVVVLGGAFFWLFGSGIIKSTVEKVASNTLKVNVRMSGLALSPFAGSVKMDGLIVDNPEGYEYENLLQAGSIYADVKTSSLLSDQVEVDMIRLEGIDLTFEQKGLKSNISEVIGNIDTGEPQDDKPQKAGKTIKVNTLEIEDITVKVKWLPVSGKAEVITLDLPPITVKDIDQKNMNIAKLTSLVITTLARSIATQGDQLPKALAGSLTKTLSEKGEMLMGAGVKVLQEGQDIGQSLIEGGKDVGSGAKGVLEGIFGGNDKSDQEE